MYIEQQNKDKYQILNVSSNNLEQSFGGMAITRETI